MRQPKERRLAINSA